MYSMSTYTCGGITGHAQDCNREMCRNVADLPQGDVRDAVYALSQDALSALHSAQPFQGVGWIVGHGLGYVFTLGTAVELKDLGLTDYVVGMAGIYRLTATGEKARRFLQAG